MKITYEFSCISCGVEGKADWVPVSGFPHAFPLAVAGDIWPGFPDGWWVIELNPIGNEKEPHDRYRRGYLCPTCGSEHAKKIDAAWKPSLDAATHKQPYP